MKINFDNSWLEKGKNYISLTDVVNMISSPFDQEAVVEKTYNKHHDNPESEYYQMTKEQILENWSEKGAKSRMYGQLLDNYIGITYESKDPDTDLELYKLDNNYDYDERLKGIINSFTHCKEDFLNKLQFVDREVSVYYKVDENNYVVGRLDALFINPDNNKWCIIDWKSSGKIDKQRSPWTKNLLGPANMLPELNWYTYTLQTFFYKCALLNHYLPEGTNEDDVKTLVIDLPGHQIQGKNIDYDICTPAFKYDKELLDKIFNFAIKKKLLLKRK